MMSDARAFRICGICSFAVIALFLLEIPFYLTRGTQPSPAQSYLLAQYMGRNAGRILGCVLLDLAMLALVTISLAGVRRLARRADEDREWLAGAFFGSGLLYVGLALATDVLQGTIAVDVMTFPADTSVVRGLTECVYVTSGCAGLLAMAAVMALGSWIMRLRKGRRGWGASVGYGCAGACLGLVAINFVERAAGGDRSLTATGPTGFAAQLPLVVWMGVIGALMLRLSRDEGDGQSEVREEAERIAISN